MSPATAAAMRAALEARLVNQAAQAGVEAGWLRRRLTSQRVLRRLPDDDRWALKGGYLLEARLAGGARTTRDLDLASAHAADLNHPRKALHDALTRDADGDFVRFTVTHSAPLAADETGLGRRYAGDQPSTRVKDLVDVVLLIEAELLPGTRLADRLCRGFARRDGRDPPAQLLKPPASWGRDYGVLVADRAVGSDNAHAAMALASLVYADALT